MGVGEGGGDRGPSLPGIEQKTGLVPSQRAGQNDAARSVLCIVQEKRVWNMRLPRDVVIDVTQSECLAAIVDGGDRRHEGKNPQDRLLCELETRLGRNA